MSTMKNHLCSFLSRLVLPGLVALLVLLSPALMRADAITTFDVSGTAVNNTDLSLGSPGDFCAGGATCPFSGMFQVDTTTGKIESSGFDISGFLGFSAFDTLTASGPSGDLWQIHVGDAFGNKLEISFPTGHTPASLVGFTGSSNISGDVHPASFPAETFYNNFSGSITPVSTVITPEPSSLVLFASGLLVLGLARRFGKKVLPST